MRYVERNLRKNEHVVATAHVSYWAVLALVLKAVLTVAIILLILNAAYYFYDQNYGIPEGSDLYNAFNNFAVILIASGGIALISALIPIIRLLCIQMVVTDKKLIGKYGVIYVHALDTYLEKIDNFTIEETILGRIFRYNTITVGTTSNTMKFKYIANARAFKNVVMDCYDARLEELMGKQAELVHETFNSGEDRPVHEGGYVPPVFDDPLDGFTLSDTPKEVPVSVVTPEEKEEKKDIETSDVKEADVPDDSDTAGTVSDDVISEDLLAPEDLPEEAEDVEDTLEDASENTHEADPEDAIEGVHDNAHLEEKPEDKAPENDESEAKTSEADKAESGPSEDEVPKFTEVPPLVDFIIDDPDDSDDYPVSEETDLDDILNFREVTDDFGFGDESEDKNK